MFLFRVGADITGRHYDAPTALAVSAAVILCWRPLYLYDGGFWLSFGAVLAMILLLPEFQGTSLAGLWASLCVNIVLLPVLLYYFYEFPVLFYVSESADHSSDVGSSGAWNDGKPSEPCISGSRSSCAHALQMDSPHI